MPANPAEARNPLRLPLLARDQELTGQTSPRVERFLRSVKAGTREHDGALRAYATLAGASARRAVPPSLLGPFLGALVSLQRSSPSQTAAPTLAEATRSLVDALPSTEQKTYAAVDALRGPLTESPSGHNHEAWRALEHHADRALRRYVSLSVYLVGEAIQGLLEAVKTPARLLDLTSSLVASRAYQEVALGSLRHVEFRERAFLQASWDASRAFSQTEELTVSELGPQILHEFLGARFRAHAQMAQAQTEAFLEFGLALTPLGAQPFSTKSGGVAEPSP